MKEYQGDLFGDSEEPEDWEHDHTHSSDPDTSHEAAESAKRNVGPQMRIVFELLLRQPMTQDELREESGLGDNAAKRCSDLKNCGWIEDSGKRGVSNRGKKAVLWTPTQYGLKQYCDS